MDYFATPAMTSCASLQNANSVSSATGAREGDVAIHCT